MKTRSLLAIGLLWAALPAAAHHSFQAEYDQSKPLTLTGKVTKVVTENPHGWIYLDAPNAQGRVVNWALELPAPNVLRRNGFDRSIYETLMTRSQDEVATMRELLREVLVVEEKGPFLERLLKEALYGNA